MKTTTHTVVRVNGTCGTQASTESVAESTPEKRRRPGAHHKPRPPRSNNPRAFIQVSPALQSELRKLEHVDLRGAGVSIAEWHKVCEAAKKAISLLQPGSRTTDVAAMFTSFATGERGQHGVDIFAMDSDDVIGQRPRKHRSRPERINKRP